MNQQQDDAAPAPEGGPAGPGGPPSESPAAAGGMASGAPGVPAGDSSSDAPTPAGGGPSDARAGAGAGVRALRITVARSGGVAGIRPSWSVTASEEADVDSWLSLVESCPWDAPDPAAAPASAQGEADRFVYTIRVVIDRADPETGPPHPESEAPAATASAGPATTPVEHDARVPERELAGPWGTLVDRVRDAATR